jgi:hypothetical protein
MNLFTKQSADQLDYDLDFSDWLTADDTITGVVATSDKPDELKVLSASISGPVAKLWIGGGLDGSTYKVTATIATQQGRIKELDFKIRVRNV